MKNAALPASVAEQRVKAVISSKTKLKELLKSCMYKLTNKKPPVLRPWNRSVLMLILLAFYYGNSGWCIWGHIDIYTLIVRGPAQPRYISCASRLGRIWRCFLACFSQFRCLPILKKKFLIFVSLHCIALLRRTGAWNKIYPIKQTYIHVSSTVSNKKHSQLNFPKQFNI